MKEKEQKKFLKKCPYCKKNTVAFHMHECIKSIQEYYGCNICDNWCVYCNKEWFNGKNKKE